MSGTKTLRYDGRRSPIPAINRTQSPETYYASSMHRNRAEVGGLRDTACNHEGNYSPSRRRCRQQGGDDQLSRLAL